MLITSPNQNEWLNSCDFQNALKIKVLICIFYDAAGSFLILMVDFIAP